MNNKNFKVFLIISVILFCLFVVTMFFVNRVIPKENVVEYICMILISLISYVVSMALNASLYVARKNLKSK